MVDIAAMREKLGERIEAGGTAFDAFDRQLTTLQAALDAETTGQALDILVGVLHTHAVSRRDEEWDTRFLCALTDTVAQLGRDALDREAKLPRRKTK